MDLYIKKVYGGSCSFFMKDTMAKDNGDET